MKKRLIGSIMFMICLLVLVMPADVYALSRDLTHDERFEDYELLRGIDVSHHQGAIDWEKVKADGVDFAIIRVAGRGYGSEGTLFEDRYGEENMRAANEVGIPFGVYIYSQATTEEEAKAEAKYLLERIKGYNVTLPVVLDYEYFRVGEGRLWDAHLSKEEATQICLAYCNEVENAGYTPMLYANKSMLTGSLNANVISSSHPIWLACYSEQANYEGEYEFWQYSSSAKVDGISGNVDVNVWYKKNSSIDGLTITKKKNDKLLLQWEENKSCYGYEVWRQDNKSEAKLIATIVGRKNVSYVDRLVLPNVKHTYRVRPIMYDYTYGEYSKPVVGVVSIKQKTENLSAEVIANSIKLTWQKVKWVQGYQIERYDEEKGKFKKIATTTETNYIDDGLQLSETYRYRVRGFIQVGNKKVTTDYSKEVKGETLNYVKALITMQDVIKGVKEGRIVTVNEITKKTYQVTLKVKGEKITTYIPKAAADIIKVGQPKVEAKVKVNGRRKLTWSEVEMADGYEIKRDGVVIKTVKKCKYTDKETVKGKTYSYRVRAYRIINGKKIYGKWTAKIKT